ncbi:MAG: efflux RND transporter periplasmic adaptor subunit [Acidobacteria bacterium]|nr:efflux RND transporter periplasmic adaptor subunit [Acidobacteriota bacterium]
MLTTIWALAGCAKPMEDPTEPAEERRVSVTTLVAKAEEVQDFASLPADLLPLRRAVLAAEVPGTVEQILVEAGQSVRQGQILASIDTRSLQQELAEAEAFERRAEARFERANRLFERRSITQQQLLDAVTDRDVAAARLASAKLRLEKSAVRAPWSGEVARRPVEKGDYVVPGQAVVEILDASRLKVRASAPAADVPYLEVGSPVHLQLEGFGGPPRQGEIVRLGAELDPATRTLEVEAEIPNADGLLKPGMYGSLEILRRTLPQALTVPLKALVDLGGHQAIFVVEDGRAHRREIQPGPVVGEVVVILEGLEAGEQVVVAGQENLGENQPVAESGGLGVPRTAP